MLKVILFNCPNKLISQFDEERKKTFVICGISFGLILLSCLLQFPPLPFDTCVFKIVTGLPCPSCGMTHSFISLGHYHVKEAFFYNLIGPFVFFSFILIFFISIYELSSKKPLLSILWKRLQRRVLMAVLFLALVSWIWNIYKIAHSFAIGDKTITFPI